MATLEQIQAKMKKLQAQAEALITKQSRAVLDDIRALMDRHNLTTADIDAHQKNPARRGRPRGALSKGASKASLQASSASSSSTATKGKLPGEIPQSEDRPDLERLGTPPCLDREGEGPDQVFDRREFG